MNRTAARLSPPLAYVGLAAIPLATATAFLVLGAGYVLDDWWFRANARFDGGWSVAGDHTGQRPLAVPLWALAFGVWAGRPVPAVLLQAAAGGLFAVCLALLLRRVLPEPLSVAVAGAWALLPTHLSLEVWLSCINLAWSQAALAVGLLVGWRDDRRWWHLAAMGGCFALAVLAYEANVVVAAVAAVALPWLRDRRPDWTLVAVAAASSAAALLWVTTHWFEGKRPGSPAPVQDVFAANVAWGFVNPGPVARALTGAAAVARAGASARLLLPSFRRSAGRPEWMILAGTGVMAAGTLPFLLYAYEPLGAGDRVNGLSAVGGALFLVGVAALAARLAPVLAVVLAAAGIAAAGVMRAERLELWSLAGRDADAIVQATVAAVPEPNGLLVFGPRPIARWKVLAFLDRTSIESALELAYDDRAVRSELTHSEERFRSAPAAARIDIRPLSALDDH
ncbi:MAG: hypothetical protein ACLGIO_13805 [Acidimicrobiia bacterium]